MSRSISPFPQDNQALHFRYMSIDTEDRSIEDARMSWEARGAFDALRTAIWRHGGSLPNDDETIAGEIRMHLRTWRRLRPQLEPLCEVREGTWRLRQVDRALQHAECHAKAAGMRRKSEISPKEPELNFAKSLKTDDLPAHKGNGNPIETPRGASIGSPSDVREAPADAPASPPLRSRKRGKGKQRPKPQPAKRRSWPPKVATSPLPDEWMPSAAGIAYALSKGLTHDDISRQLDRFANHYRANEAKRANWHFVWCGWIDRIGDYEPRQRENSSSGFFAGLRAWGAARESYGASHG
jgi:hypothetical protein